MVPVTTKVVSLITTRDEVYSIQHYVIKFVSDLLQVCGFLWVLLSSKDILAEGLQQIYIYHSCKGI